MDGFFLLSDFVLPSNQLCVCILILIYNCISLSLFALVKDLPPPGISVQHDHLDIKRDTNMLCCLRIDSKGTPNFVLHLHCMGMCPRFLILLSYEGYNHIQKVYRDFLFYMCTSW